MPFKDGVKYNISSKFGTRIDPIDPTKISFHSGLDMTAPINSEIVACGDGEVVEVGYSESGLGNYVYLKHDLGGLVYYSAYGHMLDDSIVVHIGDYVKMKDKLGIIGTTGKSTGIHLHFMIMKNELSFKEEYLINPIILIDGL